MIIKDRRTAEQHHTHSVLIVGTDPLMSGWGCAEGGHSYAAWACEPRHKAAVWRWIKHNRSALKRVRVAGPGYRPNPAHCAHLSIYVVDERHPALREV